jgi:hypothetical protein
MDKGDYACSVCGASVGLSSHYHCPNCLKECSMMGHWDLKDNDYSCKKAPPEPEETNE